MHEQDGAITDKQIMEIVNAVEFKPDDWKPWHNKRTYEGVGYLGAENIDSEAASYIKWKNMIQRCYSDAVHKLKPYYIGKEVCIEWQNYQNFKIWFDAHRKHVPTVQSDHRSRAVFTVFEINNHGFPSSFPADLLHFTYPPVPTPNTPVSAPLEAHQENHV